MSMWMVLARRPRRKPLPKLMSGCDDLLPGLKSTLPFHSVVQGRKKMSFRAEMGSEDIVSFKETLCMLGRLEALHPAFSLPGRLMGVLCSIVEVSALPMSDSRQEYSLGCTVTTELVGYDHARVALGGSQQFAKEAHSSEAVALRLHQNVNHGTVLIDGTPEIMLHAVDL